METSAITWTITPAAEAGTEGVSLRVTLGERAAEVSLPARDSHDLSRALRGPCADVSLDLWDVDHEGDRVWLTLYRTVRGMVHPRRRGAARVGAHRRPLGQGGVPAVVLDQHRAERLHAAVHRHQSAAGRCARERAGHQSQLRVPERHPLAADLAAPVAERRHHRRLQQLLGARRHGRGAAGRHRAEHPRPQQRLALLVHAPAVVHLGRAVAPAVGRLLARAGDVAGQGAGR